MDRHRLRIDSEAKARASRLWRCGQRGWPPGYPVVQFPNLPLLVVIVASLLGALDLFGAAGLWRTVSAIGVVVWALMEIGLGVNLFRRVLGAAVLIWMVAGRLGA